MPSSRPSAEKLTGISPDVAPMSVQRVLQASNIIDSLWIGPNDAKNLDDETTEAYELAHDIMKYLAIEAPRTHGSGHPGGPLSAFTFCYGILRRRDPRRDEALRMSAGHLSVLAYGLQYLGGRSPHDERLSSPQAIVKHFRTPGGLPGHSEAGIGDIPFGFGPLGKGLSNAIGVALGRKKLGRDGWVDVMMGDGDSQEGQVMEGARLASHLKLDNLVLHADINDIQLSDIPTKVVSADLAKMFQAAGWAVIEVQDGNDPKQIESALDEADKLKGNGRPIFLCHYTTMGNGVKVMEDASNEGSAKFHGSPMSDADAEEALKLIDDISVLTEKYEEYREPLMKAYKGVSPASENLKVVRLPKRSIVTEKGSARKDFGAVHIKNMMAEDPRIIVLHGDLAGSGGFDKVEKEFPDRVINCGAAEANMYMMAAGLRQAGMLPVTYTFAAFGTNEARANARLIDINAGHVPCAVLHDCTHSGLSVGEDGETHQERNYLNVPLDNTQIWCTADSNQAAAMAERAMELVAEGKQSVYVFMPRSGHEQLSSPDGSILYDENYVFDGKATLVRGKDDLEDDITIISTGLAIHDAVKAADMLSAEDRPVKVRVLNVACVRPIDASAILKAAVETQHLLVVEDHHSEGGLATQVADIIADFSVPCTLRRIGVDRYFPSGPAEDLKFMAGLDAENIADTAHEEVRSEVCGGEDVLVSFLHQFAHNANRSRFRNQLDSFRRGLIDDPSYLDSLRTHYKGRQCPADNMPDTEQLISRITDSAGEELMEEL